MSASTIILVLSPLIAVSKFGRGQPERRPQI